MCFLKTGSPTLLSSATRMRSGAAGPCCFARKLLEVAAGMPDIPPELLLAGPDVREPVVETAPELPLARPELLVGPLEQLATLSNNLAAAGLAGEPSRGPACCPAAPGKAWLKALERRPSRLRRGGSCCRWRSPSDVWDSSALRRLGRAVRTKGLSARSECVHIRAASQLHRQHLCAQQGHWRI